MSLRVAVRTLSEPAPAPDDAMLGGELKRKSEGKERWGCLNLQAELLGCGEALRRESGRSDAVWKKISALKQLLNARRSKRGSKKQ